MKTNIFKFFLLLLGIWSCGKGSQADIEIEKEVSFPLKFVFDQIEFNPSDFYVITASGHSAIPTPEQGFLKGLDAYLESELMSDPGFLFPFSLFEFISENEVRVVLDDPTITETTDTILAYTSTIHEISIPLGSDPDAAVLRLQKDEDFVQVSWCFRTWFHTYFNTSTQQHDYSGFDTEDCTTMDVQTLVDDILSEGFAAVNDTVAINFSSMAYKLEL